MSARLFLSRASPLMSRFQNRGFAAVAKELDVNTQPKASSVTPAYDLSTPDMVWVPKSFQAPSARADPTKLFADVPVANYPLPVYTTELSAERQAQFAADTVPVQESEPSPLATYGLLSVTFFGASALAANEVFLLNEESLLLGTWTCFLLTAYVQMGDVLRKSFSDSAHAMKEAHINGINQQLVAVDKLAAALEARVKSAQEAKNMHVAFNALLERVKSMVSHKHRRLLHQVVIDRLNEIQSLEAQGARVAVEAVVKRVNDTVVSIFATSPELRKSILKESIEALSAAKGSQTKVNNSLVSRVYQLALDNTRYSMERLRLGDAKFNKQILLDQAAKEKLVTDVSGAVRRAWGAAASGDDSSAVRAKTSFNMPSYTRNAA